MYENNTRNGNFTTAKIWHPYFSLCSLKSQTLCKKYAGSAGYSNSNFYPLPCLMLTTSNKLQVQASITVKLGRTLIPPKNLYPLALTTNLLIVSHQ